MVAASRIQRLRSLIEHPRTGAAERAAAQRMLDRIVATSVRPVGDRSYGDRYQRVGRHAGLSRIADMIREDIALARVFAEAVVAGELATRNAVRDAPASLTYTVDTPFDAGIRITVAGVPRAWGWDEIGVESEALRQLRSELTDIMNAYNRDGTDIGQRFHGRVEVRAAGE
ncbi:hypothetical protein VMT65_24815 [Nocardia sp. CDC153]|uniref:hypothetical protein n=1 Tax=Nocardia sp. CDC153 TaxID=3112167 RepID=UPI002DB78210|nr:hypothetical protein [Nocardia sp. CDC153]MEC3956283.1 hypothetical protein [Nocardia sp. CDC153]